MPTLNFTVQMTCSGCSNAITRILNKEKEKGRIEEFSVDLDNKKVSVTSDLSPDDVLAMIKKSGKETKLL